MKKKLSIYEKMFANWILIDGLMKLPVEGILKIYKSDLDKYYKKFECLPLPDKWDDGTFKFKALFNELFYVAKIPFYIRSVQRPKVSDMSRQEYEKLYHRFEIIKYGEKFDGNKYLKYIDEFKIDKEQTKWAKSVLVTYRLRKMMKDK